MIRKELPLSTENKTSLKENVDLIESNSEWLYFNIHDLVKMRISASHPCAYSIKDSYECFQVDHAADCDLTLSEHMLMPSECSDASGTYTFTHSCTRINKFMVDVASYEDKLFLSGKRDLLPFIGPLVELKALDRGATFIHCASMAIDNNGILMPAWGGTGKTSAAIELLKLQGSAFMGDDYAIIRDDGTLLAYPKPFFIYPYHKNLFPHLFKNKPKFIIPTWFGKPMAMIRQAVRPLIMSFPRLESICRRLTPEHMKVKARQALPSAEFAEKAPLKLILFIERYSGSKSQLDQIDPILARHRVIGNYYFEGGVLSQDLVLGCGATGLFGLEDWFGKMGDVIDEVFGKFPIYRLRIPPMDPDSTGKAIASCVKELLGKP
jgi:hypothetical protein